MNKEYYVLNLNNARYIKDGKIEYNGCLKVLPKYYGSSKRVNYEGPFFVIAEKFDDCYIDIISGERIVYNDNILSRGNFKLEDTENGNKKNELDYKEKYIKELGNYDEDVLNFFDREAEHILNNFDNGLSCYKFEKLPNIEVVKLLKKIDNPETISRYMMEIKKIINGEIAKEKALRYIDFRKEYLDKKSMEDTMYVEKYIKVFKTRYKERK